MRLRKRYPGKKRENLEETGRKEEIKDIVTNSCMDENNYMIRGLVLYQFKYYCVETTALSVLVNHYPLRQKGSDVDYVNVDSTPSM